MSVQPEKPATSVPLGVAKFADAGQVMDAYHQGIITRAEARLMLGLDVEVLVGKFGLNT